MGEQPSLPKPQRKARRESYQNLKCLSFLFFLKYESHKMLRAVAKAAMMLNEARMMAEVLMDLAAENARSLKNICRVGEVLWLLAAWKRPFLDLLKLPCGIHFVSSSSRDSNHAMPPAIPAYGDIGLIRRAAARLAMAMKPGSALQLGGR
jgi:hypothetical protein